MNLNIRKPLRSHAFAALTLLIAAGVGALACGVTTLAASTPTAWTPLTNAVSRNPERTDRGGFRLGDAGRPFGWSTAVADFNTDGKADVAVADHARSHSGQYAYRIEFTVSGQDPSRVTFESTHDAIAINVADIDRDNDLDVVVRAAVTGETVGVWLNDGHGHFTAGDARQLPAAVAPLSSAAPLERAGDAAAFEPSPRRVHPALTARRAGPLSAPSPRFFANPAPLQRSSFRALRPHPRAPPESLTTLL